jgi:hypothetical protein
MVTKCRAIVTEPEPGRILVEKNVEPTESVTTFTVVAGENGGTEVTFVRKNCSCSHSGPHRCSVRL